MHLSSDNQRILVFSDIHQDTDKINKILDKEGYDVAVNLGDEFDSFRYNSTSDVEKTCLFLKKRIFESNFHFLLGNHTLQYFAPNDYTICSGYSPDKNLLIDRLLGSDKNPIRKKFKWWLKIDGFICTHAGLSASHFPALFDLKNIESWLDKEAYNANIKIATDQLHWFYGPGKARGGGYEKGGLVWLDFNNEFEPIDGLKQIVGHTSTNSVRPHHSDGALNPNDWDNICIDCHLNEYLIIHNKKVTIKKYTDLV